MGLVPPAPACQMGPAGLLRRKAARWRGGGRRPRWTGVRSGGRTPGFLSPKLLRPFPHLLSEKLWVRWGRVWSSLGANRAGAFCMSHGPSPDHKFPPQPRLGHPLSVPDRLCLPGKRHGLVLHLHLHLGQGSLMGQGEWPGPALPGSDCTSGESPEQG